MGGHLSRQLPFRLCRNELPDGETASFATAELLVPRSGRAVLSCVSGPLPVRGLGADSIGIPKPSCLGIGSRDRGVVHAVRDPDLDGSHGRLFLSLTRAWELAIGALIAVSTPVLLRISHRWAAGITWIGLSAVVASALWFSTDTVYPGWHVAIPVIGTALVIAGGTVAPTWGAETLLHAFPFRQLGRLSYSLYLWHWPILILAAEAAGKSTLPLPQAMGWLLVALLAAVITYRFVENPIRHFKFALRHRWVSVGWESV